MIRVNVPRQAKSLRRMVTILMVCNIIGLILVPILVILEPEALLQQVVNNLLHLLHIQLLPAEQAELYVPGLWSIVMILTGWQQIWTQMNWLLHALFLLICGGCTLVILRQARDILDTILSGEPFQTVNAVCMKRAAQCCWVISAAALVRLIAELCWSKTVAPICTYNALFIPVFFIGGLLFRVMSALFQQAAELQEDQDLTI